MVPTTTNRWRRRCDINTGKGGFDIFACGGGGEDTVTDFNEAE